MSLLNRLVDAVRSWRRRRGGPKSVRRAGVSMERLDHRQLLSVTFTGNVATDFPATTSPGVVVLPDNASVTHPTIASDIAPIVKVSGFDINGLRVSYDAASDVLSVGIEQPSSQQTGQPGPVIAGDADNNGNDGTVNPAVTAVPGFESFQDNPDFGGAEYMAAFLDLNGTSQPDVVAGYSINDPRSPKQYQVAQAVVNTSQPPGPSSIPDFGTELPQFEGNVYKVNSPSHPNLEFAINDFSQLYLAETGKALTADSVIGMGAFAGSAVDIGVSEAYFPEQTFTLGQATVPPTTCPPVSPPVIINYHEDLHINTAHPTNVRVNIFGSSGFDVTKIDPSTVKLGGATPTFGFDRYANKDNWLDATFVFKGDQITLPRGWTDATVSGELVDGTLFSSTVRVFNRDRSFYTGTQSSAQAAREISRQTRANGFTVLPQGSTASRPGSTPNGTMTANSSGSVVSIKRLDAGVGSTSRGPTVSPKLQASINRMVRESGAVQITPSAV